MVSDCEEVGHLLARAGLCQVAEFVLPAAVLQSAAGMQAAQRTCGHAADAGIDVMIDSGDPAWLGRVQAFVEEQGTLGRRVGLTLQARLRRTEADCASATGRVRLVRASGSATGGLAYKQAIEVGKSYVRCAKALLARADAVHPSFAVDDTRLVDIVSTLRLRYGRTHGDLEFAVDPGWDPQVQRRLVESGEGVRVWLPFSQDSRGMFMAGLGDGPRGIRALLRALRPGG